MSDEKIKGDDKMTVGMMAMFMVMATALMSLEGIVIVILNRRLTALEERVRKLDRRGR